MMVADSDEEALLSALDSLCAARPPGQPLNYLSCKRSLVEQHGERVWELCKDRVTARLELEARRGLGRRDDVPGHISAARPRSARSPARRYLQTV